MTDDILRHVPLFVACSVEGEELVSIVVDDIPGSGRKRSLVKQKRGYAGVTLIS